MKTSEAINERQKGIDDALLVAQQAIENVAKDSENRFSNYKYTSAEAIIGACREALHGAGLVARRVTWLIATEPYYIDADGYRECIVTSTFRLSHPASGSTEDFVVPFPAMERKGMPLDKAIAAALTSGWAYWLRDLLAVPRAAEEMDKRDDSGHEAKRPQPKRNPPPTDAEAQYLDEARAAIVEAKSTTEMRQLAEIIKTKSPVLQDALRGFFTARFTVLKQEEESLEVAAAAAK
jgi:hypothetical protein